MIRSLSVIVLGTILVWPAAAHAQRGNRGGGGARVGTGRVVVQPNVSSRATTIDRGPKGGALGTAGAPGPWIGGTGPNIGVIGGSGARVRDRGVGVGLGNVAFLPQYGYGYPIIDSGFYGIAPGFNTGYYPPGVWPSPVVTSPIYPTGPYMQEMIEPVPVVNPQDAAMANELARISQQLEELRIQALQQQAAPPQSAPRSQEKPSLPTVLLMNDGQRIETQSYAIADNMLWIFDQGTTLRFPMANLDVNATQQENLKRGIRFLIE